MLKYKPICFTNYFQNQHKNGDHFENSSKLKKSAILKPSPNSSWLICFSTSDLQKKLFWIFLLVFSQQMITNMFGYNMSRYTTANIQKYIFACVLKRYWTQDIWEETGTNFNSFDNSAVSWVAFCLPHWCRANPSI